MEKIFRFALFAVVMYSILKIVPQQQISESDNIKIIICTLILFLFYDIYFPSVHVELKNDREE